MVTGASTADLTVILVDAARGVQPQTRRHAAVASLLAIPRIVFAVNKMDQVGFDRAVFESIAADIAEISRSLELPHVSLIPLSALEGDMVVERGDRLGWYEGPTLLDVLESAPAGQPSTHLRFPCSSSRARGSASVSSIGLPGSRRIGDAARGRHRRRAGPRDGKRA
jgi:sulfate adenylyltransferase subunit 1